METSNKIIGLIGLGRMGAAMAERWVEQGYTVYATDVSEGARAAGVTAGATVYDSTPALIAALPTPSVVWLMVPSQFVDDALVELIPLLAPGSTVIDGGNSPYQESRRRYRQLKERDLLWLDCGTSGGVEGARHGASLMIGGELAVFEQHEHFFASLAMADSYARVGGPGAGHFVKAVHNGIEYGMMGALAEGVALLDQYQAEFELSVLDTLKPYENGSIITGLLMSWLAAGYRKGLPEEIAGEVPVGETEGKMEHLTTLGALPILAAAIEQRRQTRVVPSRVGKYLATMRHEFGGHAIIPKQDQST